MNSSGRPLSNGVKWLMIATAAMYVLQMVPGVGEWVQGIGVLVPFHVFRWGQVWRLASYMFLHQVGLFPWHLVFNMWMLWLFGVELEQRWGTARFVSFYFMAGVGAGLCNIIHLFTGYELTGILGASGATLGIMTAYALYYPNRRIYLYFLLPVPVIWLVIIFAVISIIGAVDAPDGIAHLTHLGGIAVGFLYVRLYRRIGLYFDAAADVIRQQHREQQKAQQQHRDTCYKDVIDPLLKKISEQGMDSLTSTEKKQLLKASRQVKDRAREQKTVPLDLFRKLK